MNVSEDLNKHTGFRSFFNLSKFTELETYSTMNYTKTVDIPNSHVDYTPPINGWDSEHYNKHYEKNVKPVHDEIQKKVKQIENNQQVENPTDTQHILWNKCRYFELSCYHKDILRFVSQSAKVKIQYGNMLIGGRNKLEAVVKAFNKQGIRCTIEQNWI